MKQLITVAALALAFSTPAFAAKNAQAAPAAASSAMTPQQTRMATCNTEAAGKKGDERKAFMKQCLSGKKMSQQEKMKSCNASAKGKKGDERKAYMKECLSSKA